MKAADEALRRFKYLNQESFLFCQKKKVAQRWLELVLWIFC